jgi:hypothetical protein
MLKGIVTSTFSMRVYGYDVTYHKCVQVQSMHLLACELYIRDSKWQSKSKLQQSSVQCWNVSGKIYVPTAVEIE